jgi:two-component system, chemotaxis family, protein-glutamate methylesterase/glutaminase
VLIVDDSAVVRQVLTESLSHDPGVRMIGAVADPLFALERMKKQWPDVIVTDVEMPRMDGVMALGAVHVVTEPKLGVKAFLAGSANS